ncbi:MAG: hypothetical protein Q9227_001197 [Pyrenula ochraceoflavens]
MGGAFEILLFGDETGDFREPLQKLLERQRGVAFSHFIQKTNEALREEVRRQPRHVKEQIPPFTDVFELLQRYQDSARNQILETTFACVCQLGSIIRCAPIFWLDYARGPPRTLKALFLDSEYFNKRKTVALDIHGPFHAPHLFGEHDVDEIIQPFAGTSINSVSQSIRLISGTPETSLRSMDMAQLLRNIVSDILLRPLQFSSVLAAVVSEARSSGEKVCKVSPIGPSHAPSSLSSVLKTEAEAEVILGEQFGVTRHVTDPSGTATKIAVVGMAGRFPNANNLESLWSLLEQGLDVHRRIPPDRFDVEAHYDPTGKKKNTSHTPYGCFIEEPGLFDPRFFNMSPREAYQTDPMGRLAMVTAYEALDMSGYVPNRTPSSMLNRIGTFYGQTSDDWRQVNAAEKIDTYYIPGTIRAFASGRINYYFKFSGPSYNVDTACSSSFAAIQLACTSLQARECDTALAGGLNVMTTPDLFAGLSRAQFLSKTGSCKTFDNAADGFCRGDGVASVVLKRLEDAEADNDPILGVILGTATNHSADAVSMTQPHAPAQEYLYKKILRNTSVDPLDVSYVEMHGTGTQAGDGTEMKSISNVFAPQHKKRRPDQTLHLGAIKANIGHGEASAGVASLIKVLLMLKQNAIPPHVGIKGSINKTFPTDLDERGIRIALKQTAWLAPATGKRRAYLNNFGASGGNTGLLLEEAPRTPTTGEGDPRTAFVVSVTANSTWSLQQNIQKLISYIETNPSLSLPSLSYTTTARKIQHPFRFCIAASSISDVKNALMSAQVETIKPCSTKAPKVSFVFTGQGSHYTSMGKQLFEGSKQFRSDVMEFDTIGRNQGFPSFLPLVDGTLTDPNSLSTVALQLGQTCVQMALARLWMSWGIVPNAVLGHSLGEYAALNVAGVLSVSDTIFLVGRRAELLEKSCTAGTHAMLAVATSVASAREVLSGEELEIACINGPRETVLSGPTERMKSYSKSLSAAGIKCVLLSTKYAFHSEQVEAILGPLKELASSIDFQNAAIPVISPLLRKAVTGREAFGPHYLARHARETVNFADAIVAAKEDGLIDPSMVFVEIGPAPVCSAFVKSNLGSETVTVPSLRKNEDVWRTTSNALSTFHRSGLRVDWNEVHRDEESSLTVLSLPSYAFENKNYWLDYNNNWCLTKGEVIEAPAPKRRSRHLSTSSVQNLITEEYGDKITVVAESDLSDPDLNAAVSGHLVNGAALTPAATYADMAITIADYVQRKVNKNTNSIGMDVRELEIIKPLIAQDRNSKERQIVRITATAERPLKLVKVGYTSLAKDGSVVDEHASCIVEYGDTNLWLDEWSRLAYLFRSRIDVLAQGAEGGKFKKISRGPAYDAFSSLVQYNKKYHGMKEVILDSKNFEATSLIEFQATENDGDFEGNPYWIDNITHLSGFVLNGNDAVDSKKQVYISHGWKSLQIARPLAANKKYLNHVKMFPGPKQTMVGDVYVFEGQEMVALVGGVKFQAIPRAILNRVLPPKNGAGSVPKTQPQAAKNDTATHQKTSEQPKTNKAVSKTAGTSQSSMPSALPKKATIPVLEDFMRIISEELGSEPSELSDSVEFANVGLDSLMSLTVSGRIREDLNIDVPTSLFTDHPTVGEAKKAILALRGGASNQAASEDIPETTDAITPVEIVNTVPATSSASVQSSEKATETLLAIVSEEVGIEQSELLNMGNFADMGVDSLMSLTITGRIREELDTDIPTSFFQDYPSITDAKAAMSAIMGVDSSGDSTPFTATENTTPDNMSETSSMSTPSETSEDMPSLLADLQAGDEGLRPATSILLQGNPKTASKTLFLFPDGSGSATSYAAFPAITPNVCVYGLNCPFMKTPADYTNGIEGVAEQYIVEIKRRQPTGPYCLGGWSAGGVLAYQAMYRLLEMGEKTENLILIDSPCPINLEPLPSSLLHFVDSLGLLGSQQSTPDWLIPHFEASIINLAAYEPEPLDPSDAPKVFMIWARDGLVKDPKDSKMPRSAGEAKSVKFLLDNRTDFGPNGWERLLGADNISTETVEGNHFTMIQKPGVQQLPALIRRALELI